LYDREKYRWALFRCGGHGVVDLVVEVFSPDQMLGAAIHSPPPPTTQPFLVVLNAQVNEIVGPITAETIIACAESSIPAQATPPVA
jgi:hypothetical protein